YVQREALTRGRRDLPVELGRAADIPDRLLLELDVVVLLIASGRYGGGIELGGEWIAGSAGGSLGGERGQRELAADRAHERLGSAGIDRQGVRMSGVDAVHRAVERDAGAAGPGIGQDHVLEQVDRAVVGLIAGRMDRPTQLR